MVNNICYKDISLFIDTSVSWSFIIKLCLKYEVILPHIPQKVCKIPYADVDIQIEENSSLLYNGNLSSWHHARSQQLLWPPALWLWLWLWVGWMWAWLRLPSCWADSGPMDSTEEHPEQLSLLDSFTCDFLTLLLWFFPRVIQFYALYKLWQAHPW